MTRDEAIWAAADHLMVSMADASDIASFCSSLRRDGFAIVPLEPTEKMLDVLYGPYLSQVSHQTRKKAWSEAIAAYEKEQDDG